MHELDTALLQAMGAIETAMARPHCSVAELSRLRYETSRAVAARRRAIDLLVNEAIADGGTRAEAIRGLRGGNLGMRMCYTDHIIAWPTARAVANWQEYIQASRRLSQTIRAQIEIERELLYPHVPPIEAAP